MADEQQFNYSELIKRARAGDCLALEQLRDFYGEMKRVAHRVRLGRLGNRGMRTTTLVHEAHLRLDGRKLTFENQRHFFAVFSETVRCIQLDDVRSSRRLKRGGGRKPTSLDEKVGDVGHDCRIGDREVAAEPWDRIALDEALTRLEALDPRKAEIAKALHYSELAIDEVAELLDISPRTVDREWKCARAWLFRELSGESPAAH